MTRTHIILLVCFVLVFAAGISAGLLVSRLKDEPRRRSWLATELNLTADQQEQMHAIWSETLRSRMGSRGEDRRKLRQQRDEAIQQLLTDEQRCQYEAIAEQYSQHVEQLSQERRGAFDAATERTKKILTAEQVAKYEEILAQRRAAGSSSRSSMRPPWGMRRRSRRDAPRDDPATHTRPAIPPGQ